jgi:hypothetical protein
MTQTIDGVEQAESIESALAAMQSHIDSRPPVAEAVADVDDEESDDLGDDVDDEDDDEEAEGEEGEESPEGEESEQQSGVEQSAAANAGAAAQQAAAAEGPSFLMKHAAEQSGVDPKLIAIATSDAQLEQMIEVTTKGREAKQAEQQAEAPKFELPIELPEDEFPADDPVRKHLEKWQAVITKQFEETAKAQSIFAAFANEQLDMRDRQVDEVRQREYAELAEPFDGFLDSLASEELGTTATLNDKQREARAALFTGYQALGAKAGLDKESLQRKAEKVLGEYHPKLIEKHQQKQQAAVKQPKKVLGGSGGTGRPNPKLTEAQAIQKLQDKIDGKLRSAE